jgi:hypothetical protein
MAKTEKDIKELLGDEFEYLSEEKKGKKWHIKVLHKETNSELVCRKDKWSIDVFLKRYSVKEIKKTALKYGYEFLRIIEMCERGLRCEFRCLSCGLKREGTIGRLEEKIKKWVQRL